MKEFIAGLVVGGGAGLLVPKLLAKPIPSTVQLLLDGLRFHDVQAGVDLTNKQIFFYAEENSWRIWHIGYGLVGKPANDIIVEVGYVPDTGYVGIAIAKLASDAVEIYFNEALKATLEQYVEAGVVYGGAVMLQLS